MKIIESIREMQDAADALRKEGRQVAFVPTMGYLHEGHLALVRRARQLADVVVVSIFVNPIQFGPKEDLARYPRDFERDRKMLEAETTDIIFSPDYREMYPEGYHTYVQVQALEDHLCGLTRKGHFVGVATVCTKLFNIVKPHYAVFGQKDYQQLAIIQKMVRDLNQDLEIVPYPTVREEGGLAMSSRNTYLSGEERDKALSIYASILRLKEVFAAGERAARRLKDEAERVLRSKDGVEIEYVSISDPETLEELETVTHSSVYAVAVRVGATRLIDNSKLGEG
jgi:pantoate--beta-alanine ligase